MDIVGIICEYNPFHNGHIYHLEKVKELFPNSLVILVMSGNFTQRGIPSILDKWDKTEIALKYGIDLVIELPFVFATQSADIFAKGSISLLKELKVNYLVFGSEENNIEKLERLADISLSNDYQKEIKKFLDTGINYPTALNKALESFTDFKIETPNDLLGLSYIKEIKKQSANIKPICIKRTNNYHDESLNNISSATSIRLAVSKKIDISNSVPIDTLELINRQKFIQDDYFPFLKYKINSTDDLSIYQTVDEGIESRIKKYINESKTWEELVQNIKNKRYTYNKINRMLTHILCNFTKEKAKKWQDIEYIRILGFNKKGQEYLNKIKNDTKFPIVTTFSKCNSEMLEYEKTITTIYASVLNEEDKNDLIQSEYKNKPKMRD